MSFVKDGIPIIISLATAYTMRMVGKQHKHGWTSSIVVQATWLIWDIYMSLFSLIPINLLLIYVYAKNELERRANKRG